MRFLCNLLLTLGLVLALLANSPSSASADVQYVYDSAGRLIQATYSNGVTIEYHYDAAGNRRQIAATGPANQAPVAVSDAVPVIVSNAVVIPVLVNDTDADGDTLMVTAASAVSGGGTAAVSGGGTTVTYTAPATTGTATFTYTISDGRGGTSSATVTVTVNPATNVAPTAVNDAASVLASNAVVIDVRANDADPDGDTVTVTAVSAVSGGGTAAVSGGGTTVTYTAPATTGTATFTYTISDGRGGTSSATVTVTVNPAANIAPTAVNDAASVLASNAVVIDVRTNDTDPDGDTLTVTAVSAVTGGGTAAVSGGGATVTYTAPATGGSKMFTYTVSDGRGGTSSATVTVAVNVLPIAMNDSASVVTTNAVVIPVLSNDTDADGDSLTVTSVSAVTGGGTATIQSGGQTVLYNATAGTGAKTFTYTISDGSGGTSTATVTVAVTAPPPDYTPDPISLGNIGFSTNADYGYASNSFTVSGVNQPITLNIVASSVSENLDDGYAYVNVNGANVGNIHWAYSGAGSLTINVVNGDVVSLDIDARTLSGIQTGSAAISVTNASTGGTSLATFVVAETVDADNNFNLADYTPAPLNWTNASFSTNAEYGSAVTNTQTITGINRTVSLHIAASAIGENFLDGYVYVNVNGAYGSSSIHYAITGAGSFDLNVSKGDQIFFYIDANTDSGVRSGTATLTISNNSDGGAVLDTFGFSGTVDADNNYNVVDVAPDPISLGNIGFNTNDDYGVAANAFTVSGINQPITLNISASNVSENFDDGYLYVNVNAPNAGNVHWAYSGAGSLGVNVVNGDVVTIFVDARTLSGIQSGSATINIANSSAGGAILSSFAFTGTVDADNNFNIDYVPDSLNWNDISFLTKEYYGSAITKAVTVSGINRPVTLHIDVSNISENFSDGYLHVIKNGSSVGNVHYAYLGAGSVDVTVSNGDQISFLMDAVTTGGIQSGSATITISNSSSASTVLDIFSLLGTVDADNCNPVSNQQCQIDP